MSEFRVQSYDGWRLILIGSFDLDYYHDVEIIFTDVCRINCATDFSWPEFSEISNCACCDGRRFAIRCNENAWEVVAQAVEVVVGKTYH